MIKHTICSFHSPGMERRTEHVFAKQITPQDIVLWGPNKIRCTVVPSTHGLGVNVRSEDPKDNILVFVPNDGYLLVLEDTRVYCDLCDAVPGKFYRFLPETNPMVWAAVSIDDQLTFVSIPDSVGINKLEWIRVSDNNKHSMIYEVNLI